VQKPKSKVKMYAIVILTTMIMSLDSVLSFSQLIPNLTKDSMLQLIILVVALFATLPILLLGMNLILKVILSHI